MYSLRQYIAEKFQVSKDNIRTYNYCPKNKDELIKCIKDKIEKEGLGTEENTLDLNDIDTSEITDMSKLFTRINGELKDLSKNGYFDISDWDVSNVENMQAMFYYSTFDGDISEWNVSNVKDMFAMFSNSSFSGKNGSINNWDVSNVRNMESMFEHCINFNDNISDWNVSNVENMRRMFYKSWFKGKLSKWNVSNVRDTYAMFFDCHVFNDNLDDWHLDNIKDMQYMFLGSPLQKNPPKWYHA